MLQCFFLLKLLVVFDPMVGPDQLGALARSLPAPAGPGEVEEGMSGVDSEPPESQGHSETETKGKIKPSSQLLGDARPVSPDCWLLMTAATKCYFPFSGVPGANPHEYYSHTPVQTRRRPHRRSEPLTLLLASFCTPPRWSPPSCDLTAPTSRCLSRRPPSQRG